MNILTNPTTEVIVEVYIAYQVFSALVQSLPQPAEIGGIWYKSIYNFLSILAADFKSFTKSLPAPPFISAAQAAGQSAVTSTLSTTTVETASVSTPTSK